ncbi:Uncharacterised protein [Mycobacterium tuberculosis]|nr:Uncharacterised protein [Mycobacterium tuberculosis]CKU22993.1 Uncharacterised protein [Mycobacterium tuberculosis]CKV22982.1 Uncharacterised protein [Mycobacterium tuberculosis]
MVCSAVIGSPGAPLGKRTAVGAAVAIAVRNCCRSRGASRGQAI